MKKIVHNLAIVISVMTVVFAMACCTPFRDAKHRKQMADLRSIVHKGDNIYDAKKKIEGRYHGVSKIYDPTKLGEKLWMNVSFGLRPTGLETFSYVTDIQIPFDKNEGLSAIVEADSSGTIREIR